MRKFRSKVEWKAWVDALDASGQSVRSFAEEHDLHPITLGWWRSAFRREDDGASVRVAPSEPVPSEEKFLPVVVAPASSGGVHYVAELPNGVVVHASGIGAREFLAALAALR